MQVFLESCISIISLDVITLNIVNRQYRDFLFIIFLVSEINLSLKIANQNLE